MQRRTAKRAMALSSWFDRAMTLFMDNPFAMDNHIRPQHEFLIPGCDVFRQEKGYGQVFLDRLSERTGMSFAENKVGNYNTDEGIERG